MAEDNITIPVAVAIEFTTNFVLFVNLDILANNTPTDTSPLIISFQDIEPKSLQAEASTLMAEANITIPVAVVIEFTTNFVLFVNLDILANNTPTDTSPLITSFQDIEPKSLQAEASTLMAEANITIPVAVAIEFTINFVLFVNIDTLANNTPTPINPLASSPQLSFDRSSHAEARILIAAANITIRVAPLMIVGPPELIAFAAAITIAVNPAIPTRPVMS